MPETVQILDARTAVLEGIPVTQHRMSLAGTDTAVLIGGDGPAMVLLPGPGESALFWARVLPALVEKYRIIAPDLPGTGASGPMKGGMDAAKLVAWLDALVSRTCDGPPILVGHVVGGALAARYALAHADKVERLVLVDTLGLRRFLPSPAFGFRLFRFLSRPTAERFDPFLDQCMWDAAAMKRGLGDRWQPFLADYLAGVQDKDKKDAMGALIKHLGTKRIEGVERIRVPTALIWGRHDRATPLKVAEAESRNNGWPLHVVEASGDDPKLERPKEFLQALERALAP